MSKKINSLNDLPSVKAYLTRIGAEPRSLRTAVIKEMFGSYWKDIAVIRFTKEGEVSSSVDSYEPTELEAQQMKGELKAASWPSIKPIKRLGAMPPMMKNAKKEDVFSFRNEDGDIVMVQVRIENDKGKSYVPFTFWDDDLWRNCEPDGFLPLYNADRLKNASIVFIHEGGKAAKRVQDMVDAATVEEKERLRDHPWGRELTGAVHVGWIGGAMSPYRTDWSLIQKMGIKRAYIVGDNDEAGRSAVPAIAQQLRIPTFMVQFTDEFPASFDLGDQFPGSMFKKLDGISHYIGPAFRSCLHPATWATDLIQNKQGRPTPVLRDSFRSMWSYVEEADVFVCNEMPEIIRSEAILNKMLAPFSHVQETSRLIVKTYHGRSARICYRPDEKGLSVTFRGSSAINLHVPTTIRPEKGDVKPFTEFMDYMFVNAEERHQVLRWCATLIARPDIRMGYGMLMVSEQQGIGKTTLGSLILAPLVGAGNVGYPTENDINGAFNDWVANKRLVIINEIYSGSSWKAYHSLQSIITDRDISVNQKYMRTFIIENWSHIFACSNSARALKMPEKDRRWNYPEISEVAWPKENFIKFRNWLASGGLSIIMRWALEWNDYVTPSEVAPMTERKRDMIEGSRSDAQKEAVALAQRAKDRDKPVALLIKDITAFVKNAVQGKVFDSDYELRRAMVDAGLFVHKQRIKAQGHLQYALMNPALKAIVQRASDEEANQLIREATIKATDLGEGEM